MATPTGPILRPRAAAPLLAASLLLAAPAMPAPAAAQAQEQDASGGEKPDELVGRWTLTQLDMDLVKVDSLGGARAEVELKSRLVEGYFEVDENGAIAGLGAAQYFVDVEAGGMDLPGLPKLEGHVTLAEEGIREFTIGGTADFEAGTITLDSFEVMGGPLQCHQIFAVGGGGPIELAVWPPMAQVVAVEATGGTMQASGSIGQIQLAMSAFKGRYSLVAEDKNREHGERKGNPLHMVTGRCRLRPGYYAAPAQDPRQAEVRLDNLTARLGPGLPVWTGPGVAGAPGAKKADWTGTQSAAVRASVGASYEEAEIEIHDRAVQGNCVHLTEPPRSPAERTLSDFEKWMKDFIAIKARNTVLQCSEAKLDTVYVCVDKYDSPEVDTASYLHGVEKSCIGIRGEIGLRLKIKGKTFDVKWATDVTAASRWRFAELWLDPSQEPDQRYRGFGEWVGELKLAFVPATAEAIRQVTENVSRAFGWDVQAVFLSESIVFARIQGVATPDAPNAIAQVKVVTGPRAKLRVRTPQGGTVTDASGFAEGIAPSKSFKIDVTLKELLEQIKTQGTCR